MQPAERDAGYVVEFLRILWLSNAHLLAKYMLPVFLVAFLRGSVRIDMGNVQDAAGIQQACKVQKKRNIPAERTGKTRSDDDVTFGCGVAVGAWRRNRSTCASTAGPSLSEGTPLSHPRLFPLRRSFFLPFPCSHLEPPAIIPFSFLSFLQHLCFISVRPLIDFVAATDLFR